MPLVGFGPILGLRCCIVKAQMTQIMILKKNVHFQKLSFGFSLRHSPFLNLLIHMYRERGGLFKFIGVTDNMKFTAFVVGQLQVLLLYMLFYSSVLILMLPYFPD